MVSYYKTLQKYVGYVLKGSGNTSAKPKTNMTIIDMVSTLAEC
jgi:hypothetical protein